MSAKVADKYAIGARYSDRARVVVATESALSFLQTLPDASVSLVVTSPPYNVGKEYEAKHTIPQYTASQLLIVAQLWRVVHPRGSVCWQVGNHVADGELVPLDVIFYPLFKSLGFSLRNRIVWHFRHGLHSTRRFSGRYETLLWFTKSANYTFNLDAVRVAAKYPGKRSYKGPNRGGPSANPNGTNPSDFWDNLSREWEAAIWDFPNVKANHPEKTAHPCQFPVELAERCVLALSNPGDRVLDPFLGTGTTLIAALAHDRRAIGVDISPAYSELARQRIRDFWGGRLRRRSIGTPIYEPSPNAKVAKPPPEWRR